MKSYITLSKKQTQYPSYTIVGAFRPFPTIKMSSVSTIEDNIVPRIIYAAAENLFRSYPVDVPLLIYQFHDKKTGYDVFVERTHHGWKEWVHTYSIPFEKKSIPYMVDGLEFALQQEKEMTCMMPSMMHHVNILFRVLGI